jgi:hypothetical protein
VRFAAKDTKGEEMVILWTVVTFAFTFGVLAVVGWATVRTFRPPHAQ